MPDIQAIIITAVLTIGLIYLLYKEEKATD
jgi:hypothetical protein